MQSVLPEAHVNTIGTRVPIPNSHTTHDGITHLLPRPRYVSIYPQNVLPIGRFPVTDWRVVNWVRVNVSPVVDSHCENGMLGADEMSCHTR